MNTDAPTSAASPACPQHPAAPGQYVCARCNTAVCVDCCYTLADDTICCKTCFHGADVEPFLKPGVVAEAVAAAPPSAEPAIPAPVQGGLGLRLRVQQPEETQAPPALPAPAGAGCVQHPHVRSVAKCKLCGARVCRTCDFSFPGGIHLCPACATAPRTGLSPRRRNYLITSYVMAAWTTICMVVLVTGVLAGVADGAAAEMVLGAAVILLMAVPTIIGTAMAMSAMRQGANTIAIWIALIWNSLMLGGFVLLMVLGNLAGE